MVVAEGLGTLVAFTDSTEMLGWHGGPWLASVEN